MGYMEDVWEMVSNARGMYEQSMAQCIKQRLVKIAKARHYISSLS